MLQSLMKKTTIFSIIFALLALGAAFYGSTRKIIRIDHVGQDEVGKSLEQGQPGSDGSTGIEEGNLLSFEIGNARTNHLCIPLPEGMKAEDVMIENYYMDREMHVILKGSHESFYDNSVISGEKENITAGYYTEEGKSTRLKFCLTGVFEYHSIMESGNLYINFIAPREAYDKIIVIDPAFGGSSLGYRGGDLQEKDITLEIGRRLKTRLDETGIKVYYTRMDDNNPSEERRVAIANETKADLYIRIEGNYDQDPGTYGTMTVYNENFFIPSFGSVELADTLEYEVVSAISGKALGLIPAGEEDYTILKATVPAATVKVGYLSNVQEAILLSREDYLERVAEGIYQAILKVYEEYID